MNTIHTLIGLAPTKFVVTGAVLLGLFQAPAGNTVEQSIVPIAMVSEAAAQVAVEEIINKQADPEIISDFFGEEASTEETHSTIDAKMAFVSSRKAYPASLAVIKKHEKTIREKARKHGVPEDVAIGVGLLENGGSETAKSSAGALGVFQLMPGTARNLGLTVNGKIDERRNPEKNIDAGMRYLAANYERFGDWGLSTWAYHAGEGNVSKALQLYAKANHGIKLPGIKNFSAMRAYVEKYDITIHKLLSDSAVKTHTRKLKDDSSGYPYKVIATANLFRESPNETAVRIR